MTLDATSRRALGLLAVLPLLLGALAACSSDDDSDCTEFAGQEQTVSVRHDFGLHADDDEPTAAGPDETTALDDLVRDGDDEFGGVLTVFDSKAPTPNDLGLDAMGAILQQVNRTGSGPANIPLEPIETTPTTIAGLDAHMAEFSTTDDITYTVWVVPGKERSLDIVLAQSSESAKDVDLAAEIPDLVSAGGCA